MAPPTVVRSTCTSKKGGVSACTKTRCPAGKKHDTPYYDRENTCTWSDSGTAVWLCTSQSTSTPTKPVRKQQQVLQAAGISSYTMP